MEADEGWRRWGGEKRNGVCPQAGDGDTDTASPYHQLSQRMQDVTGDRGVLKEVIRAGAGEVVPPDASVLVKFSGYLEHVDRPFDTNCFKRNLRLMKLGEDITLRGMALGLLTMKRGELARFLFKPDYAFGRAGCPPLIPPNSTVLFEIELLDFLDTAESDEFFDLTPEQQKSFPLQKVLKVAETEREFGNYLFRQSHFMDAKDRYKRACLSLAEYERARDFLVRAQKEQPFNHDINNELKKLASCYRDYKDKEKEMCSRMFSCPSVQEKLKSPAWQKEGGDP